MSGPYTVTESDAEARELTLEEFVHAQALPLACAFPADVIEAAARAEAFRIVEEELRALGISLDVGIDQDDGVSIAAWQRAPVQTAKGPRVVVVSPQGCTSLLQAVDALKAGT